MKRLLWLPLLLVACGGGGLWWAGSRLMDPHPAVVGAPPPYLPARGVRIPGDSGSPLSAWYAPGEQGRGAVLLLHGSGGARTGMLGRARFLYRAGYGVLLIDFRGHGESPGDRMTFGYREAQDAAAALAWLRRQAPGRPLGVIGFSLGGAAALFGELDRWADALVLEAVYSDLSTAVANRLALRLGPPGRWLAPLLTWQVWLRLGVDPARLAPLARIATLRAPVMVVGGGHDRRTTVTETRALYAAAPAPKRLWVLEGAAHRDFHAFDPDGYERRVLAFFGRHLGARPSVALQSTGFQAP